MRGLLWFLGLFFLAVAVSLLARNNDGFALLVLPPWRVELSLNLLFLVLMLGFITAYAVVRGIGMTLRLPARARAYRVQRERAHVEQALEEAIRLLFEGRFGHALRRAELAWQAGHAPGTAAIIAARAATRLCEPEKVALWLERARAAAPHTAAAVLMLEAESALELGDASHALVCLERLQQEHGRHIAALRLELRARQHLGDVAGAERLAQQLQRWGALPPASACAAGQQGHSRDKLTESTQAIPAVQAPSPRQPGATDIEP